MPFCDGMASSRNFHADKERFARENSIETGHLRSNESAEKNVMRRNATLNGNARQPD
jgi:hypothetical protein